MKPPTSDFLQTVDYAQNQNFGMKLFATVHNFQSGQRFSIWSDIGSSRPGVSLTNLNHITLIRAKCCYFTDVEVGVAWFSQKIHTTSLYPGKDLDKLEGPLWFA